MHFIGERTVDDMQHISLEPYIERVYGYAMNRTFSREEAEELTQEILVTTLAELPRLRDETRFEPFLWGIARRDLLPAPTPSAPCDVLVQFK